MKLYFDSETCGLHGMPVLFQYAVEEGPITLYDVWKEPVGKTLDLIEWMLTFEIVGFNLVFDMFHLAKTYTVLRLCPRDWIPEQHINEIAALEPKGQDGPCIKPVSACDLLLHSRKNEYQSLMARSDIRIRRVPTALAYALAEELENRIQIDGIYFAKSFDKEAPKWQVFDIRKRDGDINPDFKDVVLRFSPAGGLKFLAEHALGFQPKYHFKDVELDRSFWPKELGYAPTALAVSSPEKSWEVRKLDKNGESYVLGHAWPGVIQRHIDHWASNAPAREYATDDIVYTRGLYHHFGDPQPDDTDSILACMVPVVRWHGLSINMRGIKSLLRKAKKTVRESPVNINKPAEVRRYIGECMDDTEMLALEQSTKKANLIAVSKYMVDEPEPCTKCEGEGCARCEGTGVLHPVCDVTPDCGNHPAALRARAILDVKIAQKEVELYRKLLRAKKFHASFNVVGTLSSRMSGGDGLNAQGIKSTKEVRGQFPLAWDSYQLCGGDFDSFEVTLADAVYNDPDLRKALTTKVPCHKCKATGMVKDRTCGECDGSKMTTKKLHALFGMCLFPGYSYEEIASSAGTSNDMYVRGKQGVFALIYGGDWSTLVRNLGIPPDTAKEAFATWGKWFPNSAKARDRTFKQFCSMSQPSGIGSQVVWSEPAPYVESFLGFRRYFTLENQICQTLFQLAQSPPKAWKKCPVKVLRRDRVQTAGGAVSSALYGAAFQIQAANQRAAANHEIQSPGGQITKEVERAIWDLQPVGAHPLLVAPLNIHDEIMCVTHPEYVEPVAEVVRQSVETYRAQVPLIGMTWCKGMLNWAQKKGTAETLKIRAPEMQCI